MKRITQTDIEIFNYLVKYKASNGGNTPTIRNIMYNTPVNSTSATIYCLDKLQLAGFLYRKPGKQYIRIKGEIYSFRQLYDKPQKGKVLP